MDSKGVILLFDDEPVRCEQIKNDLQGRGYQVVAPASSDDTLDLFKSGPGHFDLVLLDHHFSQVREGSVHDRKKGMGPITSGLDLCFEMAKINPTVPKVVYTTRKDRAPSQAEALAKGAYRVVVQDDIPQLLDKLTQQLAELRDISSRLRDIQESRRGMSHVIAGLAVGFQVVDTFGRIWFADEVFRRIVGDSGLPYDICYCRSHGYPLDRGMCPDCLVVEAAGRRKEKFLVFYTPTYPNGPGTPPVFQYLSVYVSPIFREAGSHHRPKDQSKPGQDEVIAAVEAVSIVPESYIESLNLEQHLEILARCLGDMGFRRVRVYRVTQQGGRRVLKGVVHRGPIGRGVDFRTLVIPLPDTPICPEPDGKTPELWSIVPEADYLRLDEDLKRKLAYRPGHTPISIALFDASRDLIGWLCLDNALLPADAPGGLPPAREDDLSPKNADGCVPASPLTCVDRIACIMASRPVSSAVSDNGDPGEIARAQRVFDKIRMRIGAWVDMDPQTLVQRILSALKEEIDGLAMAHVRRIESSFLAISMAYVGDYGEVAQREVDIRGSRRLSARVAQPGTGAVFIDDIQACDREAIGWDEFTPEQRSILWAYRSHAMYPLLAEGRPIGTACFQSETTAFFKGTMRHLFYLAADLLAKALQDYRSLQRELGRIEALEIGRRAAMLVVHNVNQPLAIIQDTVALADSERGDPEKVRTRLREVEAECTRIARIRDDFMALFGPVVEEAEELELHDSLYGLLGEVVRSAISVTLRVDMPHKRVFVRRRMLKTCLAVLLRNSLDALAESSGTESLTIVAREPDRELPQESSFANTCMAIDVIDTGPGLSDKARQTLFRYFQSSKPEGLGIGLACARAMLRAVRGDVYHAAEHTPGTRFCLLIPMTVAGNSS